MRFLVCLHLLGGCLLRRFLLLCGFLRRRHAHIVGVLGALIRHFLFKFLRVRRQLRTALRTLRVVLVTRIVKAPRLHRVLRRARQPAAPHIVGKVLPLQRRLPFALITVGKIAEILHFVALQVAAAPVPRVRHALIELRRVACLCHACRLLLPSERAEGRRIVRHVRADVALHLASHRCRIGRCIAAAQHICRFLRRLAPSERVLTVCLSKFLIIIIGAQIVNKAAFRQVIVDSPVQSAVRRVAVVHICRRLLRRRQRSGSLRVTPCRRGLLVHQRIQPLIFPIYRHVDLLPDLAVEIVIIRAVLRRLLVQARLCVGAHTVVLILTLCQLPDARQIALRRAEPCLPVLQLL